MLRRKLLVRLFRVSSRNAARATFVTDGFFEGRKTFHRFPAFFYFISPDLIIGRVIEHDCLGNKLFLPISE